MVCCSYFLTTGALIVLYDSICQRLPKWCHTSPPSAMYRTVNAVKGAALGVIAIPSFALVYGAVTDQPLAWGIVPMTATLYSALDLSAMFVMKDMHTSTVVHHVIVQFLYLYMAAKDFAFEGLVIPIVAFAGYSSIAALANVRLALRGIPPEQTKLKQITERVTPLAWQIYTTTCLSNALTQVYLLCTLGPLGKGSIGWIAGITYLGATYFVTLDDLILIRWLMDKDTTIKKVSGKSNEDQKVACQTQCPANGSCCQPSDEKEDPAEAGSDSDSGEVFEPEPFDQALDGQTGEPVRRRRSKSH